MEDASWVPEWWFYLDAHVAVIFYFSIFLPVRAFCASILHCVIGAIELVGPLTGNELIDSANDCGWEPSRSVA